jgi:hypothetical protein
MVWRRLFAGFEGTLVALMLAGCASSGFDGRVYHDEDVRFRVGPVPSAWRKLEVDDSRLAFRDDSANATVAVNGRCGLDGDDVPLTSLTQHLFLQFTDRALTSQTKVSLDGREALRSELSAALDGVKRHYLVYVLKKNGCVYDFMYISTDSASGSRADFERFVQGFAALE